MKFIPKMEEGAEVRMCYLHIQASCHRKFSEVVPEDVEKTELVVEDAMSQVLLDLYGEGGIDEVSIFYPTTLPVDQPDCSIHILAESPCQLPSTEVEEQVMKEMIARSITVLLSQFFFVFTIESIILSHLSPQAQKMYEEYTMLKGDTTHFLEKE
jgi:hypothetical protein